MKRTKIFTLVIVMLGIMFFWSEVVFAGEVITYSTPQEAEVIVGVRVRESHSMSARVLKTLPVGTKVSILAEEYGWYKINHNGEIGYTGMWLLSKTGNAGPPPPTPTVIKEEVKEKIAEIKEVVVKEIAVNTGLYGKYKYNSRVRAGAGTSYATVTTFSIGTEVEILGTQNGWYKVKHANGTQGWSADWLLSTFNKITEKEVVENKETVVEEKQVEKTPQGKYGRYIYNSRLRGVPSTAGQILKTYPIGTEVEILEEKDGWYKVKAGDGMTGWSATWLFTLIDKVSVEVIEPKIADSHQQILASSKNQEGAVPAGVDLVALNKYWLGKVNNLRAERNLRQLVLDQRWVDTATEYAAYMGTTGATGHERADGKTMHQWIDTKGLEFTERYSPNGWKGNYFTENISWGYTDGTTAGVKKALDDTLAMYLGEASYNGAHYRTTYHEDWNSVGIGFYFKDEGSGRYKVFMVFHYGSLEM